MRKFVSIVCIVTLILATLSGCSSKEESNNEVQVVLMALDSVYWRSMRDGCEAAGKELGVSVVVKAPLRETDILDQVNLIETALAQNPKAIVVAPCDAKMVIDPLDKAIKDGKRVILTDSDVEEADNHCRHAFVGISNYEASYQAGIKVTEMLKDGDTVLVINKNPNATDHSDREKGFTEGIKSLLPNVNFVTKIPEDDGRTSTYTIVSDFKATNTLNMVFCTAYALGAGAIEAVGGDDVDIIAFDTDVDTEELLEKGSLQMCIDQDPYNIGYNAVKTALSEELPDSGIVYCDCKYLMGE